MKRTIVLQHDGGELGNQLWNYASIYAYCIERGYACENWSFFEYAHYFKNVAPRGMFLRAFFLTPFMCYEKRRSAYRTQLWRRFYKLFVVSAIEALHKSEIVYSRVAENDLYYLPPTAPASPPLASLERSAQTIYFSFVSGGVFRNPEGLKKHHAAVVNYFAPAPQIADRVHAFIEPLRSRYKVLIGVHIRQGDYVRFKGGRFQIRQERVREILDEYLREKKHIPEEVCFIIASDGAIESAPFRGLNIQASHHNAGEDIFTLSLCDAIIGSDSTFGNFASYLGNTPHIVMKNESIDWDYYADKNAYFINKYFTVMLN